MRCEGHAIARRGAAALLAGLALWLAGPVRPAGAADIALTPLVAEVLAVPRPVLIADNRRHLVYEVQLANATPSAVELQKADVVDGAGKVLLSLDRGALAQRLSLGGRRGAETADLAAGQFGVLFLHVSLAEADAVPRSLALRVSMRLVQPGVDLTTTIARTEVVDSPAPVLGPPFVGKGYVAADGCCDSIRHVRALLPLNGRFALAQRYAIDWEQIDDTNRLVSGDLKALTSYVIYGREVLAVADGTVVAARNDLPEQVPGALPKAMTIDQADGNFVVQDVGGGNFVLYAHMQPGSVRVTAGMTVKRGDSLGKVGNSGNTQAPHLHLHVMDGPSPLLSNGVPYVFDSFTVTALNRIGTADFDKAEATGSPLTLAPVSPPQRRQGMLPIDLSVVDFAR
ncbi:M23 family metallopeptidase [Reyranella sp.]|uniref:M23 family metallopeptidase n=1 Tax=Reyranella sp. TaxID=1929291 RepID=UPI003BA8E3CA